MGASRVLVTGAEGTIGTAVREHLAGRFELVSLTLTPQDFPSHVADISELDAIRPAFQDVDAVVHLAASADDRGALGRRPPQQPRRHVQRLRGGAPGGGLAGRVRVLESRDRDVRARRRARAYDPDDTRSYDHTAEIRPDSLYGVSKAYGEALGRIYMERHGLRVFCLRIGAVRANDDPTASDRRTL